MQSLDFSSSTDENVNKMEGPQTVSYFGDPYNSSNTNTAVTDVSTYSWPFLFLIPIIFFTTLGNILVCIAVIRIPKLQTVNNMFLMSLAMADLMVAILVMPLGLIKDFYGEILMSLNIFM